METTSYATQRLTRSRQGYVAGVASGLARRIGVSSFIVRLVWLSAVLFFGTGLLLYLVMWWVLPHEDNLPLEPTVWVPAMDGRRKPPLQRTAVDRRLLGVCGGLARRFEVDPSVVRLAALSLAMLSAGAAFVIYLVLAIFLPGPESAEARPIDL